MKNFIFLIVISLLCIQCNDESSSEIDSNLFSALTKVTVGTQDYQRFEYNADGRLAKESVFLLACEVPVSINSYSYMNNQLKKISQIDRSFYSSTLTMCDPSSGMESEFAFEYGTNGRISKVIYSASYTELEYNSQNQISKQTGYANGKIFRKTTFIYDTAGNIISETDQNGKTTVYKYDDKINPYYLIKQNPHFISPFNMSPNNVIEASGAHAFTRSFKYNAQNLPTEVTEDNSITYTFHYN